MGTGRIIMIVTNDNAFGGKIIDQGSLNPDPPAFEKELLTAIDEWRQQGVKVAWIDLENSLAGLVPVAVNAGFDFHHAWAGGVQLTLRLVADAHIPPDATHYIGAGGVVIRENKTLLVVSERYRRGGGKHYKLPGGALRPGEHIVSAVTREIFEETRIQTRFRSLVCFRHWHGYRNGKSDIYFVCRLDPLSYEIVPQEEEIEECIWMPVADYLDHEDVHVFNKRIVRAALHDRGFAPEQINNYGTPETHEFFMPRD